MSDNFPRTGLKVFQIGVIFKAAMDGYASDKIHQELVSEEEFSVSDNFPMLMVFQIGVFFKAAMDGFGGYRFSIQSFVLEAR